MKHEHVQSALSQRFVQPGRVIVIYLTSRQVQKVMGDQPKHITISRPDEICNVIKTKNFMHSGISPCRCASPRSTHELVKGMFVIKLQAHLDKDIAGLRTTYPPRACDLLEICGVCRAYCGRTRARADTCRYIIIVSSTSDARACIERDKGHLSLCTSAAPKIFLQVDKGRFISLHERAFSKYSCQRT
jgi:hypothetical protein